MKEIVRSCRVEARLAIACITAPAVSGRYIRRFGGVIFPFIVISAVQMAFFAWHIGRQQVFSFVPWRYVLAVTVPIKTLITVVVTGMFLAVLSAAFRSPIGMRRSMSALLRSAYVMVAGELVMTTAVVLYPSLSPDLLPVAVPGLSALIRTEGLGARILKEITLAAAWYAGILTVMVRVATSCSWMKSGAITGATWVFLVLIRVVIQELVRTAIP